MSSAQSLRQLAAPWQWAYNEISRRGRWLRAGFWLVVLVAPIVAALVAFPARLAAIVVALLLSTALLALWGLQFSALLRLDHPNLARLVPGHGTALRATALAGWATATLLGGGMVSALWAWAALPAGWSALAHAGPIAVTVTVTLAAAGALLLFVALALRWPLLWPLAFLWPATGNLPRRLGEWVWPDWQAQPWLACAVLLVAMALALAALFGRGNTAHALAWERRERWRRISRAGAVGQSPPLAAYGRWGERLGAPWQRLANRWLAHATRSAEPTQASAMARAEIVLHGAQHWVRQLGVLVPLLVGLAALFSVLAWHVVPGGTARLFDSGHVGMGIGLVSMVLGTVVNLPGALWASRREQALLLLLPGMPHGVALNRALAWRQARQFLLLWALSLPAFIGIAWFGHVPQILALPAVLLPTMAWLWRDAARLRQPTGAATVLPFALCLALSVGSLMLARWRPEALLPMLGVYAGLAAVLLLWRWRQLSRWPQALPAGRWG